MSYVLEALREPKNPDITYAPDGKQIDHWTEQGFLIFLHSIILYDKIVTNSSKVGLVQWHLKQVTGPHTAELDISYSGIGDNRGGLREILSETLHYNMRLMRGGKIEPLKLPTKDRSLSEYYAGYVEEREFGTTRELLAREFLLQSLLYASHAHGETKITGNICVYAARPGVIRILSSFLEPSEFDPIKFGQSGYWDLLDRLFLPKGGYAFEAFPRTFDPLRASAYSRALNEYAPREALRTALSLRNSVEGLDLRRKWAERLRTQSASAVTGMGNGDMVIKNVSAGGHIIQVLLGDKDVALAYPQWEVPMTPRQKMENVKSGGDARQQSDIPADQEMSGVEAQGDAEQLIVGGVAVELRVLSEQLQKLQEEIRKYDAGAAAELERLRSAQQAASRGDAQATALSLKGIGRWVGDFAAQVGAILVAEVIKKQSGL